MDDEVNQQQKYVVQFVACLLPCLPAPQSKLSSHPGAATLVSIVYVRKAVWNEQLSFEQHALISKEAREPS